MAQVKNKFGKLWSQTKVTARLVQRQSLILGLTYFISTILQSLQELLTLILDLDAALEKGFKSESFNKKRVK